MNKSDYSTQVREMLQDKNTYKPVVDKRRNPTSRVEQDLQKELLYLERRGNLTEAEYWKLRPLDSIPASFYGLLKVHKIELRQRENHFTLPKDGNVQVPLRPINSCIGAPTHCLSKYLAYILKHLQNKNG